MRYADFNSLIQNVRVQFLTEAILIKPTHWQGRHTQGKPDLETYELLNHSSTVPLESESLRFYRTVIGPDLPWADDHFEERVCGYPLNPGTEWANWRMGKGADQFRFPDGSFNHNYMERFWPKYAGKVPVATEAPLDMDIHDRPHHGIRYTYGDLKDVVDQLVREPDTRQAVLPMFFPEDTGAVHRDRVPCSLSWQFIVRDNQLHMTYTLRSVDMWNHWRNDLYMAVRLLLWVLDECRAKDPDWFDIKPGTLTTHITSFHLFRGNLHQLKALK